MTQSCSAIRLNVRQNGTGSIPVGSGWSRKNTTVTLFFGRHRGSNRTSTKSLTIKYSEPNFKLKLGSFGYMGSILPTEARSPRVSHVLVVTLFLALNMAVQLKCKTLLRRHIFMFPQQQHSEQNALVHRRTLLLIPCQSISHAGLPTKHLKLRLAN